MDISNYNIEQCDAVSVLAAILDVYDKPTAKQVTLQQGISDILAAISQGGGGGSADALETEVETGKASIATAINSKGGTASSSMSLNQLAGAIDDLSVPTLIRLNTVAFENNSNNEEIDLTAIGVINNATSLSFQSFGALKKVINLPPMPSLTSMNSMFNGCTSLKEVKFGSRIDTHNVTSFGSMFNGCSLLEEIDLSTLDSSGNTSACSYMFWLCTSLKKVNIRNFKFSSNATSFLASLNNLTWVDMRNTNASSYTTGAIFNLLPNLTTLVGDVTYDNVVANNVKILDGLNVSFNSNLSSSPSLNQASLRALINGLADRTGQGTLTLTIGATLKAKLSAADIAVAEGKNWTIA